MDEEYDAEIIFKDKEQFMIIMDWPEYVNKNISIDGNFSQEEGFVREIRFENGKERTWLANSYILTEYPELSLLLDNVNIVYQGKTEKKYLITGIKQY